MNLRAGKGVSHGRAIAVAAAWVFVPLALAATVFSQAASDPDDPWSGLVPAIAFAAVLYLTPIGLLIASVWVTRRATRSASAAALGAQAGLIGLTAALLLGTTYILLRS